MILPTGKQKRQSRTPCGFTLLELMLVAIIVSALVLISSPLFKRTYEELRLTSLSKEIVQMFELCRERAIFERRPYKFKFGRDKRSYRILAEDEEDAKFKPLESRWGRAFKIPDGITVKTEKEEIIFLADGKATDLRIYLTNRENKTCTVSIESETGAIGLYDYKKE
jgi:prepilin-type N-terminal cleavage/methylation domain-containing protein